MSGAHLFAEFGNIGGGTVGAIDINVIIAYAMHLCKQDFFHELDWLRGRFRLKKNYGAKLHQFFEPTIARSVKNGLIY